MVCSMSRKGGCLDNAPTEHFLNCLVRDYNESLYTAHTVVVADVRSYISDYNSLRHILLWGG